MIVLSLLASWSLSEMVGAGEELRPLGVGISSGAVWGGVLFVLLGALSAVFLTGYELGFEGVDGKIQSFVDLLIDTENELKKVSWPGAEEVRRATIVVLSGILVLGAFLSVIDMMFSFVMSELNVLPV